MTPTTIRTSTDYRAYTGAGVLITTIGCAEQAGVWAETVGPTFPGFTIRKHVIRETVSTVFEDAGEAVAA